jgi:hypothetical protein
MGTMKRFVSLALLSIVLACPLLADTRTENIDVVVALDRSLSMEKKVEAVKSYVSTYLIDQVLIPGDHFIVVAFYGKADVIISQAIVGDADKKAVKAVITKIRGNGRFTDIGNALDILQQQVTPIENDGRKKFILLLTDGIQEAPPTSKYYSKDGKSNPHEFPDPYRDQHSIPYSFTYPYSYPNPQAQADSPSQNCHSHVATASINRRSDRTSPALYARL